MMGAETIVSSKQLKFKIIKKRVEAYPGRKSCDFGQLVSLGDDQLMVKASVDGAKKRGCQSMLECQKLKKQKMDRSMMVQCSTILKKLMSHKAGWVFNQPVDPVALNIPDYFKIISKPMDLGTIKSNLEKNMYSGIREFASDVRLTFSNAMLYNPPANAVHKMAEQLDHIFELSWKIFEEKCSREGSMGGPDKASSGKAKKVIDTQHSSQEKPPSHSSSLPKGSLSFEEATRCPLKSACHAEVKQLKASKHYKIKVSKDCVKGTESNIKQRCGPVIVNRSCNTAASSRCGKCSRIDCCCILPSDSGHASSDISSERSSVSGNRAHEADIFRLDCDAKITLGMDCQEKTKPTSQLSKSESDPDSDGAVSALDNESICPRSQLITPVIGAASAEGWNAPIVDVQLSPKRALRAAMLKRRFADTILKAQQKTLLDLGDRSGQAKLQKEKEKLERIQREETARIEAQIFAAEAATKMRAEIELQRQRLKEREAARIAVEKMEKTVEIESQNMKALKELEVLCGYNKCSSFRVATPLEKLGLFIKEEYECNAYVDDDALLGEERF